MAKQSSGAKMKTKQPVQTAAKAKPAKKATSPAAHPVRAEKPASASKPAPVAKAVAAATPRPVAKPAPAAKPAAPAKATVPAVMPPIPVPPKPVARKEDPKIKSNLSTKELEVYRKLLLNLRDQIVDEISFLAGENLNNSQREASGDLSNYGIHMADQGTDNFDREFALSLVSNEQEVLYEIDEALHRIDTKTYGMCEMSGKPIEGERLKALPYARYSLHAQEEMERNRKKYRSFAHAVPQPAES